MTLARLSLTGSVVAGTAAASVTFAASAQSENVRSLATASPGGGERSFSAALVGGNVLALHGTGTMKAGGKCDNSGGTESALIVRRNGDESPVTVQEIKAGEVQDVTWETSRSGDSYSVEGA